MSDDEADDYLSDKFLVETSAPSAPKTYSNLRKAAQQRSQQKNVENRTKSRYQREIESREEGLSKSLFERAKEEQEAGLSSGSKALSIMMKMGFKPGESLGRPDPEEAPSSGSADTSTNTDNATVDSASEAVLATNDSGKSRHKVEPLPLNEWAGKKGIGTLKRARSPGAVERVAKMAKMEEASNHTDFRDRARQQYEERRAEGRLGPAQRTCVTLDEKADKNFNILWLDPRNPDSFPEGLINALTLHTTYTIPPLPGNRRYEHESPENRLRRQMQADALQPLGDRDEDAVSEKKQGLSAELDYSQDVLEDAAQFLRLQAKDRLDLVLGYLREKYMYCFWCGTQYSSIEEMGDQCPGPDEDLHD
ncbi:hypothetical protein HGRIS_009664 [Hohenbuehelia grisea]|uniref:DUF4187 domain-containing protein n=1 Tax=Hohenbuehelia grisea TaxID=104357 RepID=A0ABR3J202_9AGAR